MTFEWDSGKNAWLKQNRRISFEEIVVHLGRGDVWRVAAHPNPAKYPGQSLAFVVISDYVHMVPFEEKDGIIRLITIIPSRKATKDYRNERNATP